LEAPFPCFFRIDGSERERVLTAWQQVIDGESVQLEVRVTEADDAVFWYRMAFHPVKNRRKRVLRVHCLMEDFTALRSDRKRLELLATTDEITGIANRALWYDRLKLTVKAVHRSPGTCIAVMTLDINQFKMYNDSLGQQGGDEILRQVASRLRKVVQDSDTLARLGGDEFGIILSLPIEEAEQTVDKVLRKLVNSMSKPFTIGDKNLCLSTATGIAFSPQHGEDPDTLVSHASSAMYRAKWNSVPFVIYEAGSTASAREQLQYSGQLHGALERNEFVLHYQPKIDAQNGQLSGAEALIRWQHPQEGMVQPLQFIPVAEQLGMIMPITEWVLTQALYESKDWSNGGQIIPVSINISARSFQSPGLLECIERALSDAGVNGSQLEIEITEGTLMLDLNQGAIILNKLKNLGVSIAIDDFGTGYSSLAYLKHLPINTLKIDQSFLENLQPDSQDAAIVRSIIELGHNLHCTVVAEGVEDQSVFTQLQHLGCDSVQGFHISKPLPCDGFTDWISNARH
jgi:diguanylate cyclase (GGDEF)-like protein